jgi:GNAT superfamily N-acetyltransferase
MPVRVVAVDLANSAHKAAIVELLDLYAGDPMGGGKPLTEEVKQALPQRLAAMPTFHAWLAFDGDLPVGVLNAFLGFSTFQARPLLNLHDVAVRPGHRGGGIGKKLLEAAEAGACKLGCCKLTLEVHADNAVARHVYEQFGFTPGQPTQAFWTKPLPPGKYS